MSEWQMPQNLMSMRTSFGPSSRRSISSGSSGAVAAGAPKARAVVVAPVGADSKFVSSLMGHDASPLGAHDARLGGHVTQPLVRGADRDRHDRDEVDDQPVDDPQERADRRGRRG